MPDALPIAGACRDCAEPLLPREQDAGLCARCRSKDANPRGVDAPMSSGEPDATAAKALVQQCGDSPERRATFATAPAATVPDSARVHPSRATTPSGDGQAHPLGLRLPGGRTLILPLSERHQRAQAELVEHFACDPGDAAELMALLEDERVNPWTKVSVLLGAAHPMVGRLHARPEAIVRWAEKHEYKPLATAGGRR